MSMETALRQLSQQEQLNFLLTNRIPRHALTRLMGWYSRIESPLLARASMALWQLFADDLHLEEAEKQRFPSLHDCFTRRLKPGMRDIDRRAGVLASPCDAIVGECGPVAGTTVFQAKGFPYEIGDLILRLNAEQGLTILLVEQKLPFARRVGSEFMILDKGRPVARGGIGDLTDELVRHHLTV